jgi:biotin transport system substrate-specific component
MSTLTLSQAIFPTRTPARHALLVVGASLLVAALAQVSIPLPFTPVPITGQTLGVLLTGIVLGSRMAALAMALYLLEGAIGLPFFAGGRSGLGGPTTGYLLSYPLAAFLTGWLAERGWDRKPLTAAAAMLTGSLVIFGLGATWLSAYVGGAMKAFTLGVLPFIPGDLLKTAMTSGLLPLTWRLLGRRSSEASSS